MTFKEFDSLCKALGLSRSDFCKLTGLAYSTVSNWGLEKNKIPLWVISWLQNYEKARRYDEIKQRLESSLVLESTNILGK